MARIQIYLPCFPRIYQSEKPGLKWVRREKNSIKPRQVFTSPSSPLEGDYLLPDGIGSEETEFASASMDA